MDKLNELKQKIEEIQTKSLVASDMKAFITLVLSVIKQAKESFDSISTDNIKQMSLGIQQIEQYYADTSKEFNSKLSVAEQTFNSQVVELKDLLSTIQKIKATPGKPGKPGKDAKEVDLQALMDSILSQIVIPEYEEETPEEIINKINSASVENDEYKIDFIHIKNVPEFGNRKANGGGWRNLFQLHDVNITTPTSGQVLKYNSTTGLWENGTDSGMVIGSAITGATAGSVLFAGAGGILAQDNANFFWDDTNNRLGLLSSAPTHSLTMGSTSTGIALYNTANQTTNYERVVSKWDTNTFYLLSEQGGTGVARPIQIGDSNNLFKIDGSGTYKFIFNRVGGTSNNIVDITGLFTGSSTGQIATTINPNVTQSGTAGYTALLINPTETSTGSGTKRLIAAQVGGVDKFVVESGGNVGIGTTAPATGLHANVAVVTISHPTYYPSYYSTIDNSGGIMNFNAVGTGAYYNWKENGVTKMMMDGNGNVGIGTTSPIGILHLANTGAAQFWISDTNAGSNLKSRYIQVSDGAMYFGKATDAATISSGLTDHMVINSSGNVGIGTTSPGQKLDVVGTIRATTEAAILGNVTGGVIAQRPSDDSVLYFGFRTTPDAWVIGASYATTGAYKPMLFATSDTERMRITTAGNVGIGTTVPSYNLQVHSTTGNSIIGVDAYDNSSNGIIKFVRAGIDSELLKITSDFAGASTTSGWSMNFYANTATPTMTIKNGNVGIGTTGPSELFHISSLAHSDDVTAFIENTGYLTGANTRLLFSTKGTDGNTYQASIINQQIGTTAGNLVFNTVGSDRMVINNTGNVGIGMTSPGAKLDVFANLRISSATDNILQFRRTDSNTNYGSKIWTAGSFAQVVTIDFDSENQSIYGGFNITSHNGANNLFNIIDNGNVGIGTTGPLYKLSVVTPVAPAGSNVVVGYFEGNGTSNDNTSIVRIITSAGTGTYTDIEQNAGGGAASFRGGSSYYDTNIFNSRRSSSDTYGNINFITGNAASSTIAMTIGAGTQKGNVGIGTATPKTLLTIGSANGGSAVVATNNKVWVKGEGAVSATAPQARIDVGFNDNPDYSAYFGSINDTYTTGAVLGTRSGGTDYATIYMKSGNVGIGTNSFVGSIKLAVSGQIGGPTYSASYLDISGAIPELRGNSGLGYYSSSGSHIFYGSGSTERMRITSAGNVGIGTTSPTSTLHTGGSFATGYIAKTANYTATSADYTIDCTANTFTVTLPTAVGITGRIYVIKNTGTGVITVDANSTETIDGALTATLNTQYESITIQSTGSNWIEI